jgi:6-phosphogluconolactonase/glucosamine-6-phosphate isomerase/deaminase
MDIRVSDQPALAAAGSIARRLQAAVRLRGAASLALSGGSTAPAMITALVEQSLEWAAVTVWQVDERVAPDGDPDRNALQLAGLPCEVRLMPVTPRDLGAAAARYAGRLPSRFDVVHLGIGDDGHTASWPPGDEAVLASERPVEVVGPFNGRLRMTLTPPVVNAARARVVLATGAAKRPVIERWLLADQRLPVTAVRRSSTVAFLDFAAASGVVGSPG